MRRMQGNGEYVKGLDGSGDDRHKNDSAAEMHRGGGARARERNNEEGR